MHLQNTFGIFGFQEYIPNNIKEYIYSKNIRIYKKQIKMF